MKKNPNKINLKKIFVLHPMRFKLSLSLALDIFRLPTSINGQSIYELEVKSPPTKYSGPTTETLDQQLKPSVI